MTSLRGWHAALLVMACSTLTASPALALPPRLSEPGGLGVGLGIGALSYGVSGKYYLEQGRAIQANFGPYFIDERVRYGDIWALGADYIFEIATLSSTRKIDLIWALGPGLAAGVSGKGAWIIDVNACAGAVFQFHELPLDFALEYRPGIRFKTRGLYNSASRVAPSFTSLGIQLRYYIR